MRAVLRWLVWGSAAVVLVLGLLRLEAERASVLEREIITEEGPVWLYSLDAAQDGPLVVVTHGFAGSRQMMQYITRDLARAGFTVAAFDFYGHGRNGRLLSPDVTRIEGTTRQLVNQTLAVTRAVQVQTGLKGPMAFVGHSMATDIIIRAAQEMPEAAAIVAISMYSDEITAEFPKRLLVLSGEWEGRLRDVGMTAVAQVGGQEVEGETVSRGDVVRRAVAVPRTEHVAVLFAEPTMEETRAWLAAALGGDAGIEARPQGLVLLGVLGAIVVLFWPLARLIPKHKIRQGAVSIKTFLLALMLPVLPAGGAAILMPGAIANTAGFTGLAAFLGVWGLVALAVLWRAGVRLHYSGFAGVGLLLVWALGVFAFALDRYGAAFLPVGPRFSVMAALLVGAIPFMLADRLLAVDAALWRRVAARIVPIAALGFCMILAPDSMGLLFTVLPVMALFFLVYGTMGRAVARRAGPETAAFAQAVILAWSIAASTPLFAA